MSRPGGPAFTRTRRTSIRSSARSRALRDSCAPPDSLGTGSCMLPRRARRSPSSLSMVGRRSRSQRSRTIGSVGATSSRSTTSFERARLVPRSRPRACRRGGRAPLARRYRPWTIPPVPRARRAAHRSRGRRLVHDDPESGGAALRVVRSGTREMIARTFFVLAVVLVSVTCGNRPLAEATQAIPSGGGQAGSLDTTCTPTEQAHYVYRPARLQVVEPCVRVVGTIVSSSTEADGDVHLQIRLDPPYQGLLKPG